jgi:hypothetical protein
MCDGQWQMQLLQLLRRPLAVRVGDVHWGMCCATLAMNDAHRNELLAKSGTTALPVL